MEKTHEIILNEKSTYNAIGELNSGHCRRIGNDKGDIFTSIIDAAKDAGVTPQYMWKCLQPNPNGERTRTCRGHIYFYIDKRDESFNRIMTCLSETSAEIERRKADEDDARKWRAYQAELEAQRKAEEKRIDDERKAKEKHEADVDKAKRRIERRTKMCERLKQQWNEAMERLTEAEKEYEMLTGNAYCEEGEVA